jgi:hypothetical protein
MTGRELPSYELKLIRANEHRDAVIKALAACAYGECEIVPEQDADGKVRLACSSAIFCSTFALPLTIWSVPSLRAIRLTSLSKGICFPSALAPSLSLNKFEAIGWMGCPKRLRH